jgi:hypothetical protein
MGKSAFAAREVTRRHFSGLLSLVFAVPFGGMGADETAASAGGGGGGGSGIVLRPDPWPSAVTQIRYKSRVTGTLSTPSASGKSDYKLESQGDFEFLQRVAALPPGSSGLWRAARNFSLAKTLTRVGGNHETLTTLPAGASRIRVSSLDNSLTQFSPDVRLTRPQLDLLHFPIDPLAVAGLLPQRALATASERWNADNRTAALLCGLDAVIEQTTVCNLEQFTDQQAVIRFGCRASGAVSGSASEVDVSGTLTLDRVSGILRSLKATIQEKRSPGAISPGLNVKGEVEWSQELSEDGGAGLPEAPAETGVDSRFLLLTLVTPWQLLLLHDRDWHVFQQTSELMVLRRVRNGALIAQCNLSRAPQQAPGQYSSQEEFLTDVDQRIQERGGQIESSNVRKDVNGWRIHHVRAIGRVPAAESAAGESQPTPNRKSAASDRDRKVLWDYYLCSAKTGEQYSLVFSHLEEDSAVFGEVAESMLQTLTLRTTRPRVALPK